jgi:hypothetical protein
MTEPKPMTEESVKEMLEAAGARAMSRGGRTENYSAPREYSFEVRAMFPNGLMLNVIARQYDYRDPWDTSGRINEVVDVALFRDNQPSSLPKGYNWFQGRVEEEGVNEVGLQEIIDCVKALNPKLFKLQELTGDL